MHDPDTNPLKAHKVSDMYYGFTLFGSHASLILTY
jgi:hypothetical protein